MTFGFFTAFPLVLMFSRTFSWMVVAFIVRGLKEFGEPTRKSLIMALAPEGKKASVFGLYYLIRDVIVSFAAFGGAIAFATKLAKEQQKVMNQTRAVLKSTGNVAGITAQQVFDLGKEMLANEAWKSAPLA